MTEDWQYRAVAVTGRRSSSTGAPAGLVEDMGRQGWALMAVVTDPRVYGGTTWAYFKRPAGQPIAA